MKKLIFIIASFFLAVLAYFVLIGVFSKMVNQSMSKSAMIARNSQIKVNASMIVPYIELWGINSKTGYAGFIDEKKNLEKIAPFIYDLERKLGVKMRYYIYSTKTHYVVRLGVDGENLFYCDDSRGRGSSEQIESTENPFTSMTDCAGDAL